MKNTLIKNSLYNVIYRTLNVIFPLVSMTYVARILYADGVGLIAKIQNIVAYFVMAAALGIPNYGTREISKVNDNYKLRNRLFSELFVINMISTIFWTFIYYLIINLLFDINSEKELYMIIGMTIPLNVINVDWFYQGLEEYKYITIRSFVVKLISLFLIFFCVKKKDDIVIYALIYCIGIAGNYFFNIYNLKKYNLNIRFKNNSYLKHLKSILIMFASIIAIELYTMLDTTMIGMFCENENVGFYSNSMKIVKIIISVITAIGGVLLPRLSYYKKINDIDKCAEIVSKVFSIMLFIFIPCQIGLFLVSDIIIPVLFGKTFINAVSTLKIASFLICTLGFSNLFGTQVLLTFNEEKKLLLCTCIGAVTNIILNFLLIPIYEQNGAAVASVISETFVTLFAFLFCKKYIKVTVEKEFIFKTFISAVIMGFSVFLIKGIEIAAILKLLFLIFTGAFVYICCNYILDNPMIKMIIETVKNRKEKIS